MKKQCAKCKRKFTGDLSKHFYKHSRDPTGFYSWCKACKSDADKSNEAKKKRRLRDLRRYEQQKNRFTAREKARDHYKCFVLECSVLQCIESEIELHHFDYEKPLEVIPLCKKHHREVHEGLKV